MCLITDKKKTRDFRAKYKNSPDKVIRVWKVLVSCGSNGVSSPCQKSYTWKIGENLPQKVSRTLSYMIYEGAIHAFLTAESAKGFKIGCYINEVVVCVTCKAKDVIALGINSDIAMKRCCLSRESYNKVLGKKPRKH